MPKGVSKRRYGGVDILIEVMRAHPRDLQASRDAHPLAAYMSY